jgi:hypothetical protein
MQQKDNRFPWGVYIGELTDNGHTLPLFLPAHTGGFTLFFDDNSETAANNFIENAALRLYETLPQKRLKTTVFDFGYKKRFLDLSLLKEVNLYEIALTSEDAQQKFSQLEKVSLYRHHELLSSTILTISDYNHSVRDDQTEPYHLLLLNLDHFPETIVAPQKIKAFFESAFEVGFYTIAFGNKALLEEEKAGTEYFKTHFPMLEFKNNKLFFNDTLPEFQDLIQQHHFKPLNDNKTELLHKIFAASLPHEEQNFTKVPLQEAI